MDINSSTKLKQPELRSRQGEAHEGSAPYRLCIFLWMALVENRKSTCFAPVDSFQALLVSVAINHVLSLLIHLVIFLRAWNEASVTRETKQRELSANWLSGYLLIPLSVLFRASPKAPMKVFRR